jgi:hypothetical protein
VREPGVGNAVTHVGLRHRAPAEGAWTGAGAARHRSDRGCRCGRHHVDLTAGERHTRAQE